MNIEDRRTENWVEDELQRRADVEEEPKIECDDCHELFDWEDLNISPAKYSGDIHLCDECLIDRTTAAIDEVSEDTQSE